MLGQQTIKTAKPISGNRILIGRGVARVLEERLKGHPRLKRHGGGDRGKGKHGHVLSFNFMLRKIRQGSHFFKC